MADWLKLRSSRAARAACVSTWLGERRTLAVTLTRRTITITSALFSVSRCDRDQDTDNYLIALTKAAHVKVPFWPFSISCARQKKGKITLTITWEQYHLVCTQVSCARGRRLLCSQLFLFHFRPPRGKAYHARMARRAQHL